MRSFEILDVDCILGKYDMYICFDDGLYMLGGDIVFTFLCFYVLVSHYDTLVLIYIIRLFMVYVFYFMFCENRKFIWLLVLSTHEFIICLVFREFIG